MPIPWRKAAREMKERAMGPVKTALQKTLRVMEIAVDESIAFALLRIQGGHEEYPRHVGKKIDPYVAKVEPHFTHTALPALLFMRGIFVLFGFLFHSKNRKFIGVVIMTTMIAIGVSAAIMVSNARADKETHAFIFPEHVGGEGFQHPESIGSQELGTEAFFSDFTTAGISSRVAFGAEASSSIDTPRATDPATSTPTTETASSSLEVAPLDDSSSVPVAAPVIESASSSTSSKASTTVSLFDLILSPKIALAEDANSPATDLNAVAAVSDLAPTAAPVTEAPAPVNTPGGSSTNSEASSSTGAFVDIASTSTDVSSGSATVNTPEEKIHIAQPRDPMFAATCATISHKECHIISLEGFGVGSPLSDQVLRSASLNISLAHHAPRDSRDRLVVRAYENGEWQYVGEYAVRGNVDNASRGGYFVMPIPVSQWKDLTDLMLTVEYVREDETNLGGKPVVQSDAVTYIDSAWIDTAFESSSNVDDLARLSPNVKAALLAKEAEDRLKKRDHLELDEKSAIDFTHAVVADGATLRLAFSTSSRAVLGTGEEYVSVTNIGKQPEHVHLNFYLPQEGGTISKLENFAFNIPDKKVTDKTAPVAYFCAAGWSPTSTAVNTTAALASSTEATSTEAYACADEVRACSSLNADKTNCYAESVKIGEEEEVTYKRGWEEDAAFTGSFRDEEGIFAHAIESLTEKMPQYLLPGSVVAKAYALPIDVEPGATRYFRVSYTTPFNARGDLYVEAAAASGNFGLGSAEFEGSWNWRVPVDLAIGGDESMATDTASTTLTTNASSTSGYVTFALDKLPGEFWNRVKDDGSDIRFADEDAQFELPFTLRDFSVENHKGSVTLKLPENGGVLPRVNMYIGDAKALLPREDILASMMGTSSAEEAEALWGTPEFVIPGEHRKFDVDEVGHERHHFNRFLSKTREFEAGENPKFTFQYRPQSASTIRALKRFFGVKLFTVDNVRVKQLGRENPVAAKIEYGDNFTWTITLNAEDARKMIPGKAQLMFTVHEGGSEYSDGYDFEWGLIALNANKATFERGEQAHFSMGALSENGNTICDANLKLFVTSPASSTQEVVITKSGKCDGNNLVDVPDYSASVTLADAGDYTAKLVRLDDAGTVLSEVHDVFHVVNRTPFIVEREGPTRINPKYPYMMNLRLAAREDWSGDFVERVPSDFILASLSGGATSTEGDLTSITWHMDMKAGEYYQLSYQFNTPVKSPFIFFIGPSTIGSGDNIYTEPRKWQVASDAAGKMLIYWGNGISPPPTTDTTWTCVSCLSTDPFFQRYVMGSSTYAVTGGAATSTHTFTATVSDAVPSTGTTGSNTGAAVSYKSHTHTFTPAFTIGSNLPLSKSLQIYVANSAGERQVPAGAIAFFETLPSSGWTAVTSYEGYFPYGESAIGTVQGATTHTHTISGTTGVPMSGVQYSGTGASGSASAATHTHTMNATTTNAVSNNPPYYALRMASANATGALPNDAITMWDNSPATGWLDYSSSVGSTMSTRFAQAAAVGGTSGGAASHTHADINNLPLNTSAVTKSPSGAGSFVAISSHYHTATFSGFSTDNSLPPYATAIFAKREVGVPSFTQKDFRFYVNTNSVDVTDPWPLGSAVDLGEDVAISQPDQRIKPGNIFRVRMNMLVSNATATLGSYPLKLQYATTSASCSNVSSWNDVGNSSSNADVHGYDNALVSDGANLATPVLALAPTTQLEGYNENGVTTGFNLLAAQNSVAEWDWALQTGANISPSSQYCLRMVEASGKVFSSYPRYPQFQTNSTPVAPTSNAPFSHALVGVAAPALRFASTDAEVDALQYDVQISTDPNFSSGVVGYTTPNTSVFADITNPTAKAPYASGDIIQLTPLSGVLSNNTTYWWRVRSKDSSGSTQYGSWSDLSAFTIITGTTPTAWYQVTTAQFQRDVLVNATTTGGVSSRLASGSIGVVTGPEIVFAEGDAGTTVWGDLIQTRSGAASTTVQYKDSNDNWVDIPDALVAGNSTGLIASTVSLRNIDPTAYPSLRLVETFDAAAAGTLSNWKVTWDYKTLPPTLTGPFSNQKVNTQTPTLFFSTTNPQGHSIVYEVEYATSSSFATSTIKRSNTDAGFTDISSATASPFPSGDSVKYTFPSNLTNGTTYYWRMRGMDSTNSVYSFYSEVRSFTIDTSVVFTTWHQGHSGQWNMDTLIGATAATSSTVQVATTSDRILMAYANGPASTPKFRIYQSGTVSAEASALDVGSTVDWVAAKASPVNDQYLLATMGANRSINAQVYEGGSWSRLQLLTSSAGSVQRRSFDLAYEKGGRALAVWCNGSNGAYRVFDGTAWGAEQAISLPNPQFKSGSQCEVVHLASSPTTNQIAAIFRNTGTAFYGAIWDGASNTWGNGYTFSANAAQPEPQDDGSAVEYERTSGTAVFIAPYNNTTATQGFIWRYWNGAAWGNTEQTHTLPTTGGGVTDLKWARLRRDPATDNLMFCGISQYAATDDGANTEFILWNGSTNTFAGTPTRGEFYPYTRHAQSTDCAYEAGGTKMVYAGDESWNTPDGSTSLLTSTWDELTISSGLWTSGISGTPRRWGAVGSTYDWYAGLSWTSLLARASLSGDIIALALDGGTTGTSPQGLKLFKFIAGAGWRNYNGSSWVSSPTTAGIAIATSPISTKPYGQPFDMAVQEGLLQGHVLSQPINFADGQSPGWKTAYVASTTPASTSVLASIEYQDVGGNWNRIPDVDLPGNSVGTTTGVLDLTTLNVNTYSTIRMRADLSCSSYANCPTLSNWRVEWKAGVPISGTIKKFDRTTNVSAGTIKYAVNGVLQGLTATVSAGTWSIANANYKNGDVVTVWVATSTDAGKATAVVKFAGSGNLSGIELDENWLNVGASTQSGQTISNSDIAKYDEYDESGTVAHPELANNVDSAGNLTLCIGSCPQYSLYVASSTTWRPALSGSNTTAGYNVYSAGSIVADANTIKISGTLKVSGSFNSGTSKVVMNATSGAQSIDMTGASLFRFYDLTFGDAASTATWTPATAVYVNDDINVNYGTYNPGSLQTTVERNLAIGASGHWTTGSTGVVFAGSPQATWSDLSAGQNIGPVTDDGTPKVLTLASNVFASSTTIGADDTLALGVYTLTMTGSFANNNTLSGGTGKIVMNPSGAATIKQGNSMLAALELKSGNVSWVDASASTTGDVLVSGGAHTFPSQLVVGGSFNQTGGAFTAAATTTFNSTQSGKTIGAISNFTNIVFGASGSWTFTTSATTTTNFVVNSGSVTLPGGQLNVGGNFINSSSINGNGGTLSMTGAAAQLTAGGGALANLTITAGATTLASPVTTIAGSLTNLGTLNAAASEIVMSGSGSPQVNTGTATLSKFTISGSGNFTMNGNATTTGDFTLAGTVGGFTYQSGKQLNVGGYFANNMTSGATWTGSTVRLYNGGTFAVSTKVAAAQSYNNLVLDNNTQLRTWNASVVSVTANGTSSLYAMNYANVPGALRIFGTYSQDTGTAYWDYSTDFDGASTSRQALVSLAPNALVKVSLGATLETIGTSTATTTITAVSGTWNLTMSSSTWKNKFSDWSGVGPNGIQLGTSTDIALLSDSKFTASNSVGGKAMSLDSSVITANNGEQYLNIGFATSSGSLQYNVAAPSTPGKYIRFKNHWGTLSGEANDADSGDPGEVRFDDSQIPVTLNGTVYSDAGITKMGNPICDGATNNITVKILPSGTSYTTKCAAADGSYSVNVSVKGETTAVIYLKGVASKAVLVTRSASNPTISGLDLYANRINVRHEDVIPMTTAALTGFDSTNDADVKYTLSGGNITVPSDMELRVMPSMTYVPGGNITLSSGGVFGSLYASASSTFTATGTLSIGGDLIGANNATIGLASSTVDFTNTLAHFINASSTLTFWNLSHSGTASTSLISNAATLNSVSLANGYLTGSGNLDHYGASFGGGAGYVSFTGGTMMIHNSSSLGGSNASTWTFNNLSVSAGATTTKTGTGVTSIAGQLNLNGSAYFAFGATSLEFTGAGNPLPGTGSLDLLSSSTVRLMPASGNNLLVPAVSVGNLIVGGSGTTTLSSATTTVRGDLSNSTCNLEHNNGSVLLMGSGSKTVNFACSLKPFNTFVVDDPSGVWSLPNHFYANNVYLNSASSFTVGNGVDFHVYKDIKNHIGDKTVWSATSNFFPHMPGNVVVNNKTDPSEQYGRITFQPGSSPVFWNSSSTALVLGGGGGAFYNASGISGRLDIIGTYTRNGGEEDWSNAVDFDGALLGVGSTRAASVYFGSGAIATYGGTSTLNVVGGAGATTTVSVMSGSYSLTASGTAVTLSSADFSGMNANGLQLKGQVSVTAIDDVYFHAPGVQGTLMSVDGSVIDANPVRILNRDGFSVAGGFNVTAIGTSISVWRFTNHYGNRAGEAYNSDPGGNPGYIAWDDSTNQVNISGYMRNKQDTGVSGMCNGVSAVIALKVEGSNTVAPISCTAATGFFSFTNIVPLQGGVITVFATGTATNTVGYILDPQTNINNLYLYDTSVSLRNDNAAPITDVNIGKYSYNAVQRPNILADETSGSLVVRNGGNLRIWNGKTYAPSGATVTLPSSLYLGTGANITGTSTLTFTSGSAASIYASSSASLPAMTFNGTGPWTMTNIATSTGSFTITTGSVTLPAGNLTIGGSFTNNGGTFNANSAATTFTGTGSQTIKSGGNSFGQLVFNGGTYTMSDNATSTSFAIKQGSVTLPASYVVQGDFVNTGGAVVSGTGTTTLSGAGTRVLNPGGSSLANLSIMSGNYSGLPASATLTGDLMVAAGASLAFPVNNFAVGGSLINLGSFSANATSSIEFNGVTTGKVIQVGTSTLGALTVDGIGGGWTMQSATTTGAITISSAGYIQATGTTLVSQGTFTNTSGGTWANSTLRLATTSITLLGPKTASAVTYGNVILDPNVKVTSWNADFATVTPGVSSSLYAMNAGGAGNLKIFGAYAKSSGTDYWDYNTDFDGTAAARKVSVMLAASSSATYSGGSLEAVGASNATTSVSSLGGVYALKVQNGWFKSSFASFANMDALGVQLLGSTALPQIDFTSFAASGTAITIDNSVIGQNTSATFVSDTFTGTSTNVAVNSPSGSNYVTFASANGVLVGDSFDNDGDATGCGSVRFDDSTCKITDEYSFRFRNDDGSEGVPNSSWYNTSWSSRMRVNVYNNTAQVVSGAAVKVTVPFTTGMRTDYADLRFTDGSGTTSIPYWIEKYSSSQVIVWLKADLTANAATDLYVYYGNAGATVTTSSGASTFSYFEDFSGYPGSFAGETSKFQALTAPLDTYTRTTGKILSGSPATGETIGGGIARFGTILSRGIRVRSVIYVDSTQNDAFCMTYGAQSPVTGAQNYATCVNGASAPDTISIRKNAKFDGSSDGSSGLTNATLPSALAGWYDLQTDWTSSGNISAKVMDMSGAVIGTTTAPVDNSYTSGGFGHTFWYLKSGWTFVTASPYIATDPTVTVFGAQSNGGATFAAAESATVTGIQAGANLRLRLGIRNTDAARTGLKFRLDYAPKAAYTSCGQVPAVNYTAVPLSSSCGASPMCMHTSSVSNTAATTPLLSMPKGLTFTSGSVVTDPSNTTGSYDMTGASYSEFEYAINVTNNIAGAGYCLRASNNGTPLDSYGKTAELGLFNVPKFTNWSLNAGGDIYLTEGTTTMVMATGTVTDYNGYTDLDSATLGSTFYRSGVTGACTQNENNCYSQASTTCSLSSCSGFNCTVSCTANVQYFAEPTDTGSPNPSETWNADVSIKTKAPSATLGTSTDAIVKLRTLHAATLLTTALDYGSITVGNSTGSFNASTTIRNTGNTYIDPRISGTDLIASGSVIASSSEIASTTPFSYGSCVLCVPVANASSIGATLLKPTSNAAQVLRNIYFGLFVPIGTKTLTHTGTITIYP